MSFQTITAQTLLYKERSLGRYVRDGVGFADPVNEFRLRPALAIRKDGTLDITITRLLEKEEGVGQDVKVFQAVATLQVSVPKASSFTPTELDSLVADISEFVSSSTIDRMLQGES